MKTDPLRYSYASKRTVVYGRRGMVCTSSPLAAMVGIDIMKRGGNAFDAAVATAAAMTVLEPTTNGIGSDAFAILWKAGEHAPRGLNASGRAPKSLTAQMVRDAGNKEMPQRGWTPVMVPGAPAAWAEIAEKHGRLPLKDLLEPAARYAEEGYPVSPMTARLWGNATRQFRKIFEGDHFKPWFDTFTPDGHAPEPGEMWASKGHADTLRKTGASGAADFYKGELADKIDAYARATGGYIRREDLEDYWCDWVDPISVSYRGYDVWEIPPNGGGIVALMALNILKGFDFPGGREDIETVHRSLEGMKLAFVDGRRYIADPKYMKVTVEELLSEKYAAERRALIGETALEPEPGQPKGSGTIYLCTADGEGNMISYIQSNYMGFGSGIVVPGTGIALQNRGANFSLDETSENCLAPGKKSYHTIIPAFMSKDGEAVGPFGVMGGFMQPQGHVQVVMNTVDFGMNPQDALDAPRWQWTGGKRIEVERAFPYALTEALLRRGHEMAVSAESGAAFGRGQIIWRDEHGVLAGGTEPRADGIVAAW